MTNWAELVDPERQTVSLRVFVDPDVYRDEPERIFGHCWLYVTHESQLPKPGDFLTHYTVYSARPRCTRKRDSLFLGGSNRGTITAFDIGVKRVGELRTLV